MTTKKYKSEGALTFKNVEVDGLSHEELLVSHDETLYGIFHCEVGFLRYKYLQENFYRKITLEPINNLYILPIGCIIGPLLSVPDVISKDDVSDKNFIIASAHHKTGKYFKDFGRRLRPSYEPQEKDELDKNYW